MCHYQPQAKLQILSRSKPNTRIYMHSVIVNTYPDDNLLQCKVILFEKRQSSFMGLCETAHTSAPSVGNPLYDSVMDEQQLSTYPINPQTSTSLYYLCNNQCWVVLRLYGNAKHLFSLCPSKPVAVVKQRLFCTLLLTHVLE